MIITVEVINISSRNYTVEADLGAVKKKKKKMPEYTLITFCNSKRREGVTQ